MRTGPTMSDQWATISNWAPIVGKWRPGPDSITFTGEVEQRSAGIQTVRAVGVALSGTLFDRGAVSGSIRLSAGDSAGRFLFGFESFDSRHVAVGIGGPIEAYVIEEYDARTGLRPLAIAGSMDNLELDRPYKVQVNLEGQRMTLNVDGIKVLDYLLAEPLNREQVGILASGNSEVEFADVRVSARVLSAFVVMQFTSPFNELYDEVIDPVCHSVGIKAYRASDIYRPGVILQDITQGLTESNLIITEITPENANVFYELGYAHALKKPVILLAERGTGLPFDISGYRVIFYDDAIRGKSSLESDLRRHLSSIFNE